MPRDLNFYEFSPSNKVSLKITTWCFINLNASSFSNWFWLDGAISQWWNDWENVSQSQGGLKESVWNTVQVWIGPKLYNVENTQKKVQPVQTLFKPHKTNPYPLETLTKMIAMIIDHLWSLDSQTRHSSNKH